MRDRAAILVVPPPTVLSYKTMGSRHKHEREHEHGS
ncbi:MAG: hypothetical protein ACI8RE_002432 [Ilumatobacter sp.]|jgi:hypothetical protein